MIFLGAGASAPFGIPTASTLTTEIHEELSKEHSNLLNDIITFWKECFDNKEPNYENILTFLTGLTDTRRISRTSIVRAFAKDHPEYKKDYEAIIDNVYSNILNYCTAPFTVGKSYIKPEELEKLFSKTYDIFTLLRNELLFTTNYDPSIELWCQKRNIRLYDGTESTNNPEVKRYIPAKPETIETGETDLYGEQKPLSLKLVRLHGSVWTYSASSGRKIKFNRPRDKLLFEDWYSHLDKRPLMIFPGQELVLSSGEWDAQYQYFKKMLRRNCLVIGYSFNDNLINNVFIDNLKSGALSNIGILDPNPEEVIRNLFWNETTVPRDRIVSLPFNFGSDNGVQQVYYQWIGKIYGMSFQSGVTHWISRNVGDMKKYIE